LPAISCTSEIKGNHG